MTGNPEMSTVRRSITITFLARNAATVITFLSGLILARLLEPSEIGLFSMTAVFVGVMHTFRDFGVVSYLLREKDLTIEKIRAASGMLIATSWFIALCLFALAAPVARFYGQPPVAQIMEVLSLGFLFIPFGSVTQALLRRELAAEKQAAVLALSTFAYVGSCIALASMGFGYMSMAWANLINILVTTAAFSVLRPATQPWMPSFKGWRAIAHFGGGSALSNLMTNMDAALPDTLLGRRMDAHAVGLFSRGSSLVELFTQVVMPAVHNSAVPVIAKNFHEQRPLSADLSKSVVYITGVAWPVLIFTTFFAESMIHVLYGPKWLECLPIITFLCIASAVRAPFGLTTPALLGVGRPYVSAFLVGATLLLKLGMALVLRASSLREFAQAFMLGDLLALPIILSAWKNHFKVGLRDLSRAIRPSLRLTLIYLPIALVSSVASAKWPELMRLMFVCIVSLASWIVLVLITKHPLSHEVSIVLHKLRTLRTRD